MKVLINQFFGIGDIIYCIGIARHLQGMGHDVHWPVLPQYLDGLRRAYPDCIEWHNVEDFPKDWNRQDECDWGPYRVLPLRYADQILGYNYDGCMAAKYDLFGLSNTDWREHARFVRDEKKEQQLLALLPGARVDKPFTLGNR